MTRPATVRALDRDGWPVAERVVFYATREVVERAADELRRAVRLEIGWDPRIVVLDDRGRDVTGTYEVA